jgi:small subunit ribosomal protein S20
MAQTPSAKKMIRKIARRTAINRARRSATRSAVRRVEDAIAAGNKSEALTALKHAEPVLVRAAQKGLIHRNGAARKISRLTRRVRAMA